VSHGPTFGVYQDNADGCFKIGGSRFKYNNKHVFVSAESTRQLRGFGNC